MHVIGPIHLLERVLRFEGGGCSGIPICLASFCERNVRRGGQFIDLARKVFGVCGTSSDAPRGASRMGLLGVHHVAGRTMGSALVTGVGSNVRTDVRLSLVGDLPSFLLPSSGRYICICASDSLTIVSGQLTRMISFRRHPDVGCPCCYNRLCVSSRGDTLLQTQFRLAPQCVRGTTGVLIRGEDHGVQVVPRGIICAMSCGP